VTTDVDHTTLPLTDPSTWLAGVPHATFDALRAKTPVARQDGPFGPYWSLTRHEDIAAVTRDQKSFTSTKGILHPIDPAIVAAQQNMMLLMDPPAHTRLRRMASKSFTPKVVAHFHDWIRDVVCGVLDEIKERQEFDFVHDVAARVPALVIASILGVTDQNDREHVYECANDVFAMYQPDGAERLVRGVTNLAALVRRLREEKRENPAEDMITALNEATDSDGKTLSDTEYESYIVLLNMAGFETTHTLMAQSVRTLVENPEINEAVKSAVADGRADAAVEELLRYITPINYFARSATSDVQVGGEIIHQGDQVLMWYQAANRDPEVFDRPHEFVVGRRSNPHMAFGGGGVHHCIGNQVARVEMAIFLQEMFAREEPWELAGEPVRGANLFVNQLVSLPLRRR
jgi:cytochrome P450